MFCNGRLLAEQFYRLGNRFFNVNQKQAAEWPGKKRIIFPETEKSQAIGISYLNLKRLRFKNWINFNCGGKFLCDYFFLFEREPELFQFTTLRSSAGELSFWDEWWDKGRP
ncbi:MAG: hypothetical protein Ct9H300mP28_33420 [Pseudomonadota bacterium]|nr:MAG: hypothetical protein Ct9H300mP28_33420 [Pseudomonadota bacterium]